MPPTPRQIPQEPVQEGSRWRHQKPSGEEVAAWFRTVPLDEGMAHDDFIAGVVLIPAVEKVKVRRPDGSGTDEHYEDTWTPYVRVDTRVSYFRKLAELRELVAVIEPVEIPRSEAPAFDNRHMPDGFWWHIAGESQAAQRFLCCTMRVALYRKEDWLPTPRTVEVEPDPETLTPKDRIQAFPRPLREGRGTKQVTGAPDINGLAKAETGAIGRALGVAGILVVGTGIATAEDMQDLREPAVAAPTTLPGAGAPEESPEALNERLATLQARLRQHPDAWREFTAWWSERAKASGWRTVDDATPEARKGVATKMEGMLAELSEQSPRPEPPPPGPPIPAPPDVLPTQERD